MPAHNRQDLTGQRFGKLLVIEYAGLVRHKARWRCRCDCGTETSVEAYCLTHGKTVSCECYRESRKRTTAEDISGQRFGRLTAVRYVCVGKNRSYWVCCCDCGKESRVPRASLQSGNTTSCGCFRQEVIRESGKKNSRHGKWKTPEFRTWQSIRQRCYNPKGGHRYVRYGGRGLAVCQRWRQSFENFYADMGDRPSGDHSIERKDNSLGYTCGHCDECKQNGRPANCCWATAKQQQRNTISNRVVEWNGVKKTVIEWAEETGIPYSRLINRFRWGWPADLALTAPFGSRPADLKARRLPLAPEVRQHAYAVARLNAALQRGRVTRPPHCQRPGCGTAKVQAHHWRGYERERWLDVIWLCTKHHAEAEGIPADAIIAQWSALAASHESA